MDLSRRQLFQFAGSAAAAALLVKPAQAEQALKAAAIYPKDHNACDAVRSGVRLGLDDARYIAELVGMSFELTEIEVAGPEEAALAARNAIASGASTVFGGISAPVCRATAEAAPESFLELRARDQLTPAEEPIHHLAINPAYTIHALTLATGLRGLGLTRFAVSGSNPVLTGAARSAGLDEVPLDQAQVLFRGQDDPDPLSAEVITPLKGSYAHPVAWHHSLRQNGAAQLNARFKAETGENMDDNAWYGWLGVKLIAEAAMRARPIQEHKVNGYKGAALSFQPRRLKQPLYVIVSRPNRNVNRLSEA